MIASVFIENWQMIASFFLVAMLYASVGFGGGSSYLALLAFFGMAQDELRPVALICNIVVVSGGLYVFYISGFLKVKKALPLVALSVPFAFIGGSIRLDERLFFLVLGFTLIVAAFIMLFQNSERVKEIEEGKLRTSPIINSGIGGGIGFLSGLVGIGGGIFLAPLLHLTYWDKAKVVAATASLFILLNSIAGLIGQWSSGALNLNGSLLAILVTTVFIGGQIGSRWGALNFNPAKVRLITAVLIVIVGIRILVRYL